MRTYEKNIHSALQYGESHCSSLISLKRCERTLLPVLQEFVGAFKSRRQRHTSVIAHVRTIKREYLELHTEKADRNGSAMAESSDGTFLYLYDNRMCYFDTLIEKF